MKGECDKTEKLEVQYLPSMFKGTKGVLVAHFGRLYSNPSRTRYYIEPLSRLS